MILVLASIIIYSFIVLASVIMIVNYNHIVITIVNYDRKTFIVQATGVIVGELFFHWQRGIIFPSVCPWQVLRAWSNVGKEDCSLTKWSTFQLFPYRVGYRPYPQILKWMLVKSKHFCLLCPTQWTVSFNIYTCNQCYKTFCHWRKIKIFKGIRE